MGFLPFLTMQTRTNTTINTSRTKKSPTPTIIGTMGDPGSGGGGLVGSGLKYPEITQTQSQCSEQLKDYFGKQPDLLGKDDCGYRYSRSQLVWRFYTTFCEHSA